MTSLVGFEALLRNRPVVTYGMPFYAGWGLTRDRAHFERRTRRRTVDELVAATLLRYPRYYSWSAHAFCTPHDMVRELALQRDLQSRHAPAVPPVVRKLRGLAVSVLEWARAL
jgi:capsular polysaccharide export protein